MEDFYAVYRNSLVYIFMLRGYKRATVLRSFELAIKWGDILYVSPMYDEPRKAEEKDFDYYRILEPESASF